MGTARSKAIQARESPLMTSSGPETIFGLRPVCQTSPPGRAYECQGFPCFPRRMVPALTPHSSAPMAAREARGLGWTRVGPEGSRAVGPGRVPERDVRFLLDALPRRAGVPPRDGVGRSALRLGDLDDTPLCLEIGAARSRSRLRRRLAGESRRGK